MDKKILDSIKHLAELSALEFSESGLEKFAPEFQNILKFVDQIAKIKTVDQQIFSREINVEDLREDEVQESMDREKLLSCAPKQRKGHFNVPKVVE